MSTDPHDPLDDLRASTILRWLKDYRFLLLGLVAVIAAAVTSFFATKGRLGNDIEDLRARLARNEYLRDELGLKTFHLQMINLRILEDEVQRIQKYVDSWKAPEFKYDRPAQATEDYVRSVDGPPIIAFEMGPFPSLVTSNETRAIRNTELTATLASLMNALAELNFEIAHPGGRRALGMQDPRARTVLAPPMTKRESELFKSNSATQIAFIKGLLQSGILGQLRESRAELKRVVTTFEEENK